APTCDGPGRQRSRSGWRCRWSGRATTTSSAGTAAASPTAGLWRTRSRAPTACAPGSTAASASFWRRCTPATTRTATCCATRFQRDRMPGDGSLPTGRWRPGDRIGDYYKIELPHDLAAGEYRIVIGLYRLEGGQRLKVVDRPGEPNELEVARLGVAP